MGEQFALPGTSAVSAPLSAQEGEQAESRKKVPGAWTERKSGSMAKTKQSGSAAQRRAQERQQRSRREEARTSALQKSQNQNRGPKMRKKDRSGLYMVIGVLALIAAIIVIFIFVSQAPVSQPAPNANLIPHPADPAIVRQLTGVSQSTWEAVGTGGLSRPFGATGGRPSLTGPGGHPEFLYIGGMYCPNCAAERWAMLNALSRFGTFQNLDQVQSFEYNVSTFSFAGSSYTSRYIDFVPKEILGNALDRSKQSYVSLQKLTAAEQQIFKQYDSGQTFPFMDINGTYIATAASYDFSVLLDSALKPLTWQTIAASFPDTHSPITKSILGAANYLTAAICSVTHQQPGSVCGSAVIGQIEQALNATSQSTGASPLVLAPARLRAVWRFLM